MRRATLARLRSGFLGAALVSLAACSSPSSSTSSPAPLPAELTPDTLPDAFAHAACDGLVACCGAAFDTTKCVATWRGAAPKPEAAVTHAFDASAARACVDAMRASRRKVIDAGCRAAPVETLTPIPEVNAACALVYTGTHHPGEPCSSTLDCLPGIACGRVDATGTGLCRASMPAAPDGPCDETGPTDAVSHACSSADGFFCSIDTHRCTPWLDENAPCNQLMACGPTRMCNEGVCAKRLLPGTACCWPFACTSGFCRKDGVCADPGAIPPDQVCDY